MTLRICGKRMRILCARCTSADTILNIDVLVAAISVAACCIFHFSLPYNRLVLLACFVGDLSASVPSYKDRWTQLNCRA